MLICVTNRKLCSGDFIDKLIEISYRADAVILREKDLTEEQYTELAAKCIDAEICSRTRLVVNKYINSAKKLGIKDIQLSMNDFKKYYDGLSAFDSKWVSVHSVDEACEAYEMGADYLIAGHIFSTECKKGLEPRGLVFLESVCKSVGCPVLAIGGINKDNISDVINAGATGACIMSGFMTGKYN